MALVGGGGHDPPGGGGHLFAPPEFLEPAGGSAELETALGGLSFSTHGGAAAAAAADRAAAAPPSSSAVPIAIPGGPGGLRRPGPGGLGGVPGDDLASFIPVAGTADGVPPPLPSPSTTSEQLSAAFAARCEVGAAGGVATGPLGVPTGASASAGAPPLLAGIDEEDDLDLVFGEDDDDLLRALDTAGPGHGPPPPGGSALWAEYGASAPAAGMADFYFPGCTPAHGHHHGHGHPSTAAGGIGAAAPARHPSTAGFSIAAVSPAALHAESNGVPIPAAGGLTRSFAAAGGHHFGTAAGSAASDADAWPVAASLPAHLAAGGPGSVLSPAHARAGVPAYFPRAPSAPVLWPGGVAPGGAGGHHPHPPAIRGFAVGTPPVGSAPGTSGFLVGSLGAGGAGSALASSLSGSIGRSASRGGGSGPGAGRPLSATSPALKHSSSHGSSLARAAVAAAAAAGAPASRAGRVSRPPRRPLDDDDGSFESGSYGAGGPGSFGAGGSGSGGRGAGGGRKHHNPWSVEETEALVAGVEACGGGKWADIKKLGWATIDGRSAVDLKDKWRNLTRLVSLPSALPRAVARSAAEPGGEKRRLPPELLERVRALMPADPDMPYGRITASRAPGARSRARNRR